MPCGGFAALGYLNTSHVNLQPLCYRRSATGQAHLNTSHVNLQLFFHCWSIC